MEVCRALLAMALVSSGLAEGSLEGHDVDEVHQSSQRKDEL